MNVSFEVHNILHLTPEVQKIMDCRKFWWCSSSCHWCIIPKVSWEKYLLPLPLLLPPSLLLLQALQLHSLNFLAFSTHNFHLLRSWMQLVHFFIFSFFISFIISSFHLFFGLPSGLFNIGFHLCTLFTILSSGIRCKWPSQLNL